jgi:CDP-paratose 2-epimerase
MATSPTSTSLEGDALRAADARGRAHGIGESRPLDFHTPYGCSKGAADQYVLDYARSFGVPTAVMRMSCIYGQRQMGTEDQGWVAHFLIRALEGRADHPLRRRRQVRDILDVSDAVDAYLARLGADRRGQRPRLQPRRRARPTPSACAAARPHRELLGREVDVAIPTGAPATSATSSPTPRDPLRPRPLASRAWREGVAALADWLREERAARPRPRGAEAATGGERRDAPSLRVLITADAVGGVWQYSLDLARGLRAARRRDGARGDGPVADRRAARRARMPA